MSKDGTHCAPIVPRKLNMLARHQRAVMQLSNCALHRCVDLQARAARAQHGPLWQAPADCRRLPREFTTSQRSVGAHLVAKKVSTVFTLYFCARYGASSARHLLEARLTGHKSISNFRHSSFVLSGVQSRTVTALPATLTEYCACL